MVVLDLASYLVACRDVALDFALHQASALLAAVLVGQPCYLRQDFLAAAAVAGALHTASAPPVGGSGDFVIAERTERGTGYRSLR